MSKTREPKLNSPQYGERDQALLTAACDVFCEKGYHGASVRDLADAAGYSIAGLYHYFKGKQEILVSIMQRVMDDLQVSLEQALASANEPPEKLAALIRSLVVFQAVRSRECFVGNTELRSLEPPFDTDMIDRRDAIQRMFDDVIKQGCAGGDFSTIYPYDVSRAIVTMAAAVASWYKPDRPLPPDAIAERYVVMAFQMLGATIPAALA